MFGPGINLKAWQEGWWILHSGAIQQVFTIVNLNKIKLLVTLKIGSLIEIHYIIIFIVGP